MRGAAAVVCAVFAGLALVVGALVALVARPSRIEPDRLIDEVGWVSSVDAEERTFSLSTNFLGVRAKRIAVNHETQIQVGDKEGAFGDIRLETRLEVAYRVRPTGLVAEWIGIDARRPRQARPPFAATSFPGERSADPAPDAGSGEVDRHLPSDPARAEARSTPPRDAAPALLSDAGVRRPAKRTESQRGRPRVSSPAPPPALTVTPSQPARPDEPGPDGAIDWLLKERGRR